MREIDEMVRICCLLILIFVFLSTCQVVEKIDIKESGAGGSYCL